MRNNREKSNILIVHQKIILHFGCTNIIFGASNYRVRFLEIVLHIIISTNYYLVEAVKKLFIYFVRKRCNREL